MRFAVVVWWIGLSGCTTPGMLEPVEPLGAGGRQVSAEVGAHYSPEIDTSDVVVSTNVTGRFGLSPRVDMSVRGGTQGARWTTKVLLTPPESGGTRVAIAPGLGGAVAALPGLTTTTAGVVDFRLPVLIGVPLKDHELVVSVYGRDTLYFAGLSLLWGDMASAWSNQVSAGTSLGLRIHASPRFEVFPELQVEQPIWRSTSFDSDREGDLGNEWPTVNLQVGLMWRLGKGDEPS